MTSENYARYLCALRFVIIVLCLLAIIELHIRDTRFNSRITYVFPSSTD